MKLQICVVRDSGADCYGQPYFVPSVGAAVRAFGDEVKREDKANVLNAHPEHFSLWHVGTYDDASASFDLFASLKQLALASDYKG